MSNNTVLSTNIGTGDTIRTIDRSGIKTPASFIDFGTAGAENLVAAANGLPVAILAGSAVIGHVIVDSGTITTVSTVTAVTTVSTVTTVSAVTSITNALPAGTNLLGKVGIDQTTPGTTNLVSIGTNGTVAIGTALPAGANVIGHVIADTGSTTAVTGNVTVVQATGTNLHAVVDSGTITTVSTVTAVTSITNALPAGTNLLGQVSASNETATVYSGTTALTPKFKSISVAASGDNTLVAGVSTKKIRVLSLFIVNSGTAVSTYFVDNTAGTAIFGDATNKIPLDKSGAAGPGGFVLPYNPVGWMQSSTSNPLVINLSAAQAVAGGLTYVEV